MKDYRKILEEIETAVGRAEALRKAAFHQYTSLVDAVAEGAITDPGEIERIMDGLLDFGDLDEFLNIYKKLCRHVFDRYPELVRDHITLWRAEFENQSDETEVETYGVENQ